MKIQTIKNGNTEEIVLEGRLDYDSAEQLEKEVAALPSDIKHIILNLEKLEYIASRGLRSILSLVKITKENNGEVTIKNPNEMVLDILEGTGFGDLTIIEK